MKQTKPLVVFFIPACIALTACSQKSAGSSDTASAEPVIDTVTEPVVDSLTIDPPQTYSATDTNQYIKLISTGTFHSDELWDGVEQETWYGIYHDAGAYFVEETAIRAARVNDPIVDETENERTGWEISDSHPGASLALISGLEFSESNLPHVTAPDQELIPGDSLTFSFGDVNYALFASGTKITTADNPEYNQVENYKLFLSGTKDGETVTQLLVEHTNFDESMVNVLLIADLDKDGIPDMLLNNTRHYNVTNPTLYLSSGAGKNTLLQIVGWHYTTGC
ncbi:MAG: hypothetical protein HYZ14_04115 [Bacteroidetes bacterium]|nr:hypothetical protein [Bacteroidota bacterium]